MTKRTFYNVLAVIGVVLLLFSATVLFSQSVINKVAVSTLFTKLYAQLFILDPVDITIPAGSGVAEYSVATPTKATYQVTNSDTDGARLYIGETSVTNGQIVVVVNRSANTVTIVEVAGVREMGGDAVLGIHDVLAMQYADNTWTELFRKDN